MEGPILQGPVLQAGSLEYLSSFDGGVEDVSDSKDMLERERETLDQRSVPTPVSSLKKLRVHNCTSIHKPILSDSSRGPAGNTKRKLAQGITASPLRYQTL